MKKRRNLAFDIGLISLAAIVGFGFSLKPWNAFREQSRVRDEYVDEMKKAESRSEELARNKARLESPLGKEELARKNGFHRPGEQPIEDNE